MRHYNKSTYHEPKDAKKQIAMKTLNIAQVANGLLEYIESFDTIVPYEYWKNKKDILYLTKQEYELAQSIALKKAKEDTEEVFQKLCLREKY